jgi:hypothetical protein
MEVEINEVYDQEDTRTVDSVLSQKCSMGSFPLINASSFPLDMLTTILSLSSTLTLDARPLTTPFVQSIKIACPVCLVWTSLITPLAILLDAIFCFS